MCPENDIDLVMVEAGQPARLFRRPMVVFCPVTITQAAVIHT